MLKWADGVDFVWCVNYVYLENGQWSAATNYYQPVQKSDCIVGYNVSLLKMWWCLQEFSGEDNSDLFLQERETAIVRAQQEKRQIQLTVPGIIGPHELPEEMQDWDCSEL